MSFFTHNREYWQDPQQPVSSSNPPVDWPNVDMIVIHYTAAGNVPDGDVGESQAQVPVYLRRTQNDYVTNRGYSVGYNACVDQWGASWELRGETFRNAANKGDKTWHRHEDFYPDPDRHNCNKHSFSVLVLVDGADPATEAAQAEISRIVAWARTKNPDIEVVGHKDVDRTGCPGNGLYAQIYDGSFEQEESDMLGFQFEKKRLLDTRQLGGPTAADGQVITLQAPGEGVQAVKVNVTAVSAAAPGYVTLYPAGFAKPGTSDLNYKAGWTVANQVDVPVNGSGQFSLFVKASTHIIVDLVGVWRPALGTV